jgi:hypothetical protein
MQTRPRLTIELIAIRAVLELPDTDRPEASESSDEFTCEIIRAFRPLAKTRPETALRKLGGR